MSVFLNYIFAIKKHTHAIGVFLLNLRNYYANQVVFNFLNK